MPLVVDANVVISALIADGTTRELLVVLDKEWLTPAVIRDEIDRHRDHIVERSDLSVERVDRFLDLLFSNYITLVPVHQFVERIEPAEQALGTVDPDDVLYLATALARDAGIWSDDGDFREQELVPVYTTADMAARLGR